MYISKKVAFIVSGILMLGSVCIGFHLMASNLDSDQSEEKKRSRAFLDALAVFMSIAAVLIAGLFELFPD